MRSILTALCIGLLAFGPTGCGEKISGKTPMDLKDVPPEILKVAKDKLPGVTFKEAFREGNGNYELRGKDKNDKTGKIREIDIIPDGTVEEVS